MSNIEYLELIFQYHFLGKYAFNQVGIQGPLKSKSLNLQILINLLDKEIDLDCFVCGQTLRTNIMVVNLPVSKTLLIYTTSIEKESNL